MEDNRRDKSVKEMIEELKPIKDKWIESASDKSKGTDVDLVEELSSELYKALFKLKDERKIKELKLFMQSNIRLDANSEASENTVKETGIAILTLFIASLSLFISSRTLLVSEGQRSSDYLCFFILLGFIVILCIIVSLSLSISTIIKHLNKYSRKKSFYEMAVLFLDEFEKEKADSNSRQASANNNA